ncbi:NADH-ubiquinone oxidoreductase complex I, 21 kDa subunit-domain-containing protein [Mycena amicta]|nr:NADH-ubiquinone oxidoreductase complex I, 21 kDa subunit-domain-containing protein [Mycena amicta]
MSSILDRKHRYPLLDADPHAKRVISYMRPSDYATWMAYTAGTPAAFYAWEKIDRTGFRLRPWLYTGAFLGCCAGFLVAYSRSTKRFWGWTENAREERRDLEELSQRTREGTALYGESSQPEWVKAVAHRNSQYSLFKSSLFPMLNLVNHPYHGKDPKTYGSPEEGAVLKNEDGRPTGEILRTKRE